MPKHHFCDLNVELQDTLASNLANLKQLIELGYQTVALNRYLEPPKNGKELGQATALDARPMIEQLQAALSGKAAGTRSDVRILSRVTIPIETVNQLGLLRNQYYKSTFEKADIVAIKPGNERVCKILGDGKVQFDVLSLDLHERMEWSPTPKSVQEITSKDYLFEVLYVPSIKSSSLRKHVFRNAVDLVRRTHKGTGIIISSGGEHPMDFRSPADIMNLAELFSLTAERATEAVTVNCQRVIIHAQTAACTTRGVMIIEKISDTESSSLGTVSSENGDASNSKEQSNGEDHSTTHPVISPANGTKTKLTKRERRLAKQTLLAGTNVNAGLVDSSLLSKGQPVNKKARSDGNVS